MIRPEPQRSGATLLHGVHGGLFRHAPVPLMVADARSRRIVEANDALASLVGRLPEELRGASLDALDAASGAEISEYLLLILAARHDGPHVRTLQAWDGTEIPVEVRGAPLGGGHGSLVTLYVRDVRDEQEAGRERGRLRSQLWMAQKQEAVGRLAAGIAHDFSNLLAVVMLTSEALRERLAGDREVEEDLDMITEAGFRARELTVDLLAFSGRQMREPRPVGLNEIVGGMEGLLRRTISENVDLTLRLSPGQGAVNADPSQLQQVLLNLVVNARDAMPDGGRLVIATQEVEVDEELARKLTGVEPGPHVLLSVSDTGLGMDEETRERIFEPFFSTRSRDQGAGLGLSTVYGIVNQSGGSVWVESSPGMGSTFRVYLPRLAGAVPHRSRGPRGVRIGGVPGGTEHVLLVEDDADVRHQTARILEDLGYTVTRVASPDDAAMIHDDLWPERGPHPIALLLTDVIMPGMSGPELVRRIRTKREDLPVIYMSGYLDPMGRSEGPSGPHLAKPFSREELARSVRVVLDG